MCSSESSHRRMPIWCLCHPGAARARGQGGDVPAGENRHRRLPRMASTLYTSRRGWGGATIRRTAGRTASGARTMPKQAEISYVTNMVRVLKVSQAEVEHSLMTKPYGDPLRGSYFLDLGQMMKLLPSPPARLLDLGTGSGWTAEFFARCGYGVLGVDVAPDMIELARRRLARSLDLRFEVCDYEARFDLRELRREVVSGEVR